MKAFETTTGYVVRLDLDEEILTTLTDFVLAEKIEGAIIQGIGAVKESVLGYFDVHDMAYREQAFAEDMELVSFLGNLTWADGDPIIHAHVLLSGNDFVARGGHLFSSKIAVTGEFSLQPTGRRVQRALDERTGLKLMAR